MKRVAKIGYTAIKIAGALVWIGALGNVLEQRNK